MGENKPNIDSRYSPIYQRGGTGAQGAQGAQGSLRPSPRESQQRQGTPQEMPAHPSPEAPAHPSPEGPAHPSPGGPANVVEVIPEGTAPHSSGASTSQRLNPFVLVMWLLGAALLALGLWAVFAPLQVDETSINGPFPQWVFIISQSAGGIVVSGSILLAAAGALSAIVWDRRRR